MTFSLEITATALREIDEALEYRVRYSVKTGVTWYVNLMAAIRSLTETPEQWALAPESAWYPGVRQLLYGKKRNIYRVLFEIRGDIVYILRVRHGAQNAL